MRTLTLAGHYQSSVEVDVCESCCLIWFDEAESARLAGPGIAALVKEAHGAMQASLQSTTPAMLALEQRCPICRADLVRSQDFSRFGRTSYLRCPQVHGYLQSFALYLAEKGFIRPTLWKDFKTGTPMYCASCGSPLPMRPLDACPYCQSSVAILDPARLASAIDVAGAAAPLASATITLQDRCPACGGSIDITRDLRCPHCSVILRDAASAKAIEASAAVEAAVRANYQHQDPAISAAKLKALRETPMSDTPSSRGGLRFALAMILGVATVVAIFRQLSHMIEQRTVPEVQQACAPDAEKRRQVRIERLVFDAQPDRVAARMHAAMAGVEWRTGRSWRDMLDEHVEQHLRSDILDDAFLERGDLALSLANAAFCLPVGSVSQPIEIGQYYYLVRVVEVR